MTLYLFNVVLTENKIQHFLLYLKLFIFPSFLLRYIHGRGGSTVMRYGSCFCKYKQFSDDYKSESSMKIKGFSLLSHRDSTVRGPCSGNAAFLRLGFSCLTKPDPGPLEPRAPAVGCRGDAVLMHTSSVHLHPKHGP